MDSDIGQVSSLGPAHMILPINCRKCAKIVSDTMLPLVILVILLPPDILNDHSLITDVFQGLILVRVEASRHEKEWLTNFVTSL